MIEIHRPRTGLYILTPENCEIFKGIFSLLHTHVKDEDGPGELYRGVFAVLAFPVSSPDRYISLRYHDENNKENEIGVIIDPKPFSREAQELLLESLSRHYFEYEITKIYNVEWKYGLLFFDVETQQGRRGRFDGKQTSHESGRRQFEMLWQHNKTQDHGDKGKILLDVLDNRYVIPDFEKLPREDLQKLTRYIYW